MKQTVSDIDCQPFAPVLMESTRAIGYSMETAIADIIDNSIAAKATEINIFFQSMENPCIAIIDNGVGMDQKTITEAMRYGSMSPLEKRSEQDLGRYGLGLKTASLSQCRDLTVVAKQNKLLEGRVWDLDYVQKTQKWSLQNLTRNQMDELPFIDHLLSLPSGTMVLWRNLDKIKHTSSNTSKSLDKLMQDVRKHLELVFHRYLSGDEVKRIKIKINELELVPFDPFFVSKSMKVMDDEIMQIPGRSSKIVIRPFQLPHPSKMTQLELEKYGGKDSLKNLQGFYIYRNKRLLTWGTWFKFIRMDEFSKLARVRVDIPNDLDDLWTLDIKKSTAYPPEMVRERLKQLVTSITAGSKKTWTFRQKKEVIGGISHVWDRVETRSGVKYAINMDHPMLKMILDNISPPIQKMVRSYLETIQNNLLFNNLHYDMHSDIKILQDETEQERERVLFMMRTILKKAKEQDNIDLVLEKLQTTEPFLNYMDELEKIRQEVMIHG